MNSDRIDAVLAGLGNTGEPASVFGPVVTKTASSVLAERIRAAILDGELSEGTVMPTERELAERTGLGRSTVREALRLLQAAGLVTSRPGAKGGSVVQLPHVDDVVRSLDVFIRGRRLSFASLLETREALEPMCARLAARARTDADLETLGRLHDRMSVKRIRQADFTAANAAWHLAIAQASHNELLSAFMSAIGRAIELGITQSSRKSAEVRPQVLHAHERILDAIRGGDPDAAMRRMLKHVHAYTEQVADWQLPDDLPLDDD
jgi:DNA-binding FadR family transcriptional regulator